MSYGLRTLLHTMDWLTADSLNHADIADRSEIESIATSNTLRKASELRAKRLHINKLCLQTCIY